MHNIAMDIDCLKVCLFEHNGAYYFSPPSSSIEDMTWSCNEARVTGKVNWYLNICMNNMPKIDEDFCNSSPSMLQRWNDGDGNV